MNQQEENSTFVTIDIKLFEELERVLTTQNEYSKINPEDKVQSAYVEGIISALEALSCYTYTFDKQTNKIIKIIIR